MTNYTSSHINQNRYLCAQSHNRYLLLTHLTKYWYIETATFQPYWTFARCQALYLSQQNDYLFQNWFTDGYYTPPMYFVVVLTCQRRSSKANTSDSEIQKSKKFFEKTLWNALDRIFFISVRAMYFEKLLFSNSDTKQPKTSSKKLAAAALSYS